MTLTTVSWTDSSDHNAAEMDLPNPTGLPAKTIIRKVINSLPFVIGLGAYLFILYLSLL